MGVEDAEAPRREDEEADPREEDPHQADHQIPLGALEPGRHKVDQPGASEHPHHHECADTERQDGADGARQLIGALRVLGVEGGVSGDERGREGPFSEEVLQEVGNAERRGKCVRGVGGSEKMRGGPRPDEADDPAQEDAQGDEDRAAACGRAARLAQEAGPGGSAEIT